LLQALHERRDAGLPFRIVRGSTHEHADAPHPLKLLRTRRQRPRNRSAADERDERPTFQLTALHRLPLTTVTA